MVLTGHLTHLVPHITAFTKTYQAVVCFGKETDTLDPSGKITKKGKAPSKAEVQNALTRQTGAILQVPPAFSALHVGGKRASDLARSGKTVQLEARQVFVYKNELLDFKEAENQGDCSYALLEITCSKGTYIRSIARDLASLLGTCAHLTALRRVSVGPFLLSEAAGASELLPFTIERAIDFEKNYHENQNAKKEISAAEIKKHFLFFTKSLAESCGFETKVLKKEAQCQFFNGKPLRRSFFEWDSDFCAKENFVKKQYAVFAEKKNPLDSFCGIIFQEENRFSYGFVVPSTPHPPFFVYSWSDIKEDNFPLQFKKIGTALSVGSFDGVHAGHLSLWNQVLSSPFVPGIVTFSSSVKTKSESTLLTLAQKLDLCKTHGIVFAIVIDFSPEFSKINGEVFLEILRDKCGLRFLSEGQDFHCGYKGEFGIAQVQQVAKEKGFLLKVSDDVLFEEKRISSTRIRDSIKNGNFEKAKKMLLRPFELDCSDFDWQIQENGNRKAKVKETQIIPKNGTYSVLLKMSETDAATDDSVEFYVGASNEFLSECRILENSIEVQIPNSQKEKHIRAIIFL